MVGDFPVLGDFSVVGDAPVSGEDPAPGEEVPVPAGVSVGVLVLPLPAGVSNGVLVLSLPAGVSVGEEPPPAPPPASPPWQADRAVIKPTSSTTINFDFTVNILTIFQVFDFCLSLQDI